MGLTWRKGYPIPEDYRESPRLITIASFSYPSQAHLAKVVLERDGIESFIHGEYAGVLNLMSPRAVQLLVREEDGARACEILGAPSG